MKDLSLYIHIPFCKAKCHYCAFVSFTNNQEWIDPYINKLISEIMEKAKTLKNYRIETIYIGGGTPSLIDAKYIAQILDTVRAHFEKTKNAEITIESNPESLTNNKLEKYIDAGINRFSIGCQSLNNKTLKTIGRVHSKSQIIDAINLFHRYMIRNFSLDFIMGLPFQTFNDFKNDLKEILDFSPPHLSFYFLSPDTKKIKTMLKDSPNEDEQIQMYQFLTKQVKKHGYHHYEVSNYAKPGFECKHNLRYWEQKEYMGFGAAAHSFINDTVYENESSLIKYINNPPDSTTPFHLDKDLKRMDYIMMRLRTSKGINLPQYEQRFGNKNDLIKKALPYLETNLLKHTPDSLQITENGTLILDKIIDELI